MGKPAARMGDSTAHGGTIVLGMPMVLIGGQPAARITDMHVCPMVTGVVPHVGGPILPPGGIGVLIGSLPAARMGDMVTCVGPPDVIVKGEMTVLIGEISGGGDSGGDSGSSGGGGAGGAAAAAAAIAKAVLAQVKGLAASFAGSAAAAAAGAAVAAAGGATSTAEKSTREAHWIRFEFKDKAGFPVAGVPVLYTRSDGSKNRDTLDTDGAVDDRGLPAGTCSVLPMDVSNAQWSAQEAKTDEPLTMTADTEGINAGTPATITVFRRDLSGPDAQVAKIECAVDGDAIEGEWTYSEDEESGGSDPGYTRPEYFFVAASEGLTARSPMLSVKAWIEVTVKNEDGDAIAEAEYRMRMGNGEVREGKADRKGKVRIEDVPPGPVEIELLNVGAKA